MLKNRIIALLILLASVGIGFFVYHSQIDKNSRFPFRLGLDLSGGIRLTYAADVSKIPASEVSDSMESLRQVVERRINLFGVTEPVVQAEKGGIFSSNDVSNRLIVELPGITDLTKAEELIGKTPQLEFKLVSDQYASLPLSQLQILAGNNGTSTAAATSSLASTTTVTTSVSTSTAGAFIDTGLNGTYLDHAQVQFDSTSNQPMVALTFNDQGKKLFGDITSKNVGKPLAIFLDGQIEEAPTINEAITSGQAQISGNFTPQKAKQLADDLNYGALPVPISLLETQSIGATLGGKVLDAGVLAGIVGFILVALFLILFYRLPGLLASITLIIYIVIILALFKLIPVTITAAGIAGLILSMGIAVDANILMFSRMREEYRRGKNLHDSVTEGFSRAWTSIRDGNISAILTAVILFWLGTSIIKGFALTLIVGVLISLLTAASICRLFLLSILPKEETAFTRFLFGMKR